MDFFGSGIVWRFLMPLLDALGFLFFVALLSSLRIGTPIADIFRPTALLSAGLFGASLLASIAIIGGYRSHQNFRTLNFSAEFLIAIACGALVGFFIIFVFFVGNSRIVNESRAVLIVAAILFTIPALGIRVALVTVLGRFSARRPYLLIGDMASIKEFSESYQRTGLSNPLQQWCESEELASESFWDEVRREFEAVIIVDSPDKLSKATRDRLARMHFDDLRVYTLNSFYAAMWRQVPTLHLDANWLFEQNFRLAERSYYRIVKRSMDLLLSTILLLIASPLMILAPILIKLDSRGPVFFRQQRVGRHRRVFTMIKFRSMQVGNEDGDLYVQENDQRVTRIGRFLRRLRFDELPQLINVWKGDMSLIGPRPEWTILAEGYEREIPFYHLRHLVRPGVTGWAQLNFPYGASLDDAIGKLRYDLFYIQFYSLVLDLEIILKTAWSVLSFRGR